MDLNFWNSIAGIISGAFTLLSFVVAVLALKQPPHLIKGEGNTQIEVVQRIEHVYETKIKKSNKSPEWSDDSIAIVFIGFIVSAITVFFFSKHLHQIQTLVMVLGSVSLFVSTLLFWIVRVRGLYPMSTNAKIILVMSGLIWAVGFMVLSPIDSRNIKSVSALHHWNELTHNFNDVTWMGIVFNAIGVVIFFLIVFIVLVQLLRTVSILSNAAWLNRYYRTLSWRRSIAPLVMVIIAGLLMHGYVSLWFDHLQTSITLPKGMTSR